MHVRHHECVLCIGSSRLNTPPWKLHNSRLFPLSETAQFRAYHDLIVSPSHENICAIYLETKASRNFAVLLNPVRRAMRDECEKNSIKDI